MAEDSPGVWNILKPACVRYPILLSKTTYPVSWRFRFFAARGRKRNGKLARRSSSLVRSVWRFGTRQK
jgi:hypothetical protein